MEKSLKFYKVTEKGEEEVGDLMEADYAVEKLIMTKSEVEERYPLVNAPSPHKII